MILVNDVVQVHSEFLKYLRRDRGTYIDRFSAFGNGFEGWVKHELAHWLCENRALRAGDGVLLEDRNNLDRRTTRHCTRKDGKIVDVVVAAPEERWHHIELKVFFNNGNWGKMADSAGWDLWLLQRLQKSDASPASVNLLVLGSGFELDAWHRALERVVEAAELQTGDEPALNEELGGGLRAAFWHLRSE